jgi:transposase
MRKPPRLPEGSKEKLYVALKKSRTKGQYQKVLCLWMRAALEMTSDQIALALGMSPWGVRKIQARWLHAGEAIFKEPGKGGAHRRRLTKKAEREFLERLLKEALPANAVMNTVFIQEAYEKMVGHPVEYSVVYRLLKRHGWRPVRRVDMRTPREWAAAKLPLTDPSAANSPYLMSDAEVEAAIKGGDGSKGVPFAGPPR